MKASEPALVKRVAIIGPECTGKSFLSAALANHYGTTWAPEYARGYLDNLVRAYNENDLITIAHGQVRIEDENARRANRVVFCDTNLYVIKVWSEFKYGRCAEEILDQIQKRKYDLYLLTYIDIPWEADPQREHPTQRQELYDIYLNEMKNQAVPFYEIKGQTEERLSAATRVVDKLFE